MELTPVLIVATIFYFIYALAARIATRKERQNFFDIMATMDPTTLLAYKEINPQWEVMVKKNPYSALRTACLLLGLGIGLVVVWVGLSFFYPGTLREIMYDGVNGFLILGSPLLFAGLGLLVAYLIERKKS
ncbi:MAG: hypothetical protein GX877_06805 [Bacteroidales bacterium]|nr:hypothetical protein [Bacteroidales bacterium]